ncbi:PREDICTED: condensin-2 complex subunit D3 [Fragaria vesca subsp. vesca]|uniref:condensin-2 complex subunit D3 n=1 Tax=Fragaria vesca subsp. vesca TaxID=101020 RepID=UPI0002C31379|nr:PREDICTED: condensin-2 complex subunit D3 [Fragaria vesca subsp. vesca]
MDESIARIVTELEDLRHLENPANTQTQPISDSTLSDLQTLLDAAADENDPENPMDRFSDELASKSLSLTSLVRPISAAMDSGPAHFTLAASKLYLSLLLSPNSPVCTLFTPMAFFSLLQSIRRSLKHRRAEPGEPGSGSGGAKKRKARGKGKGLRNSEDCESEEREFDVRVLFSVLEKLELVMDFVHLERFPDSLKSLVQTVAEIPGMGFDVCGNSGSFNKLTGLCSRVLLKVFELEHGDHANIAAEVFKSLTPMILQHKSQVRIFALSFVGNQMMNVARNLQGVKKAMVNFLWYLVHKAPDKSEPRALAVESIMEIVRVMEVEEQVGFVEYVVKMTQGKARLRLLAVDLILVLVTSLRGVMGLNSESEVRDSLGWKCLEALIQRCSDAMAGIRARGLSNLSQLVGFLSGDDRSRTVLKEVMGFGDEMDERQEGWMNEILRARCMDEKAAVRKAALLLVTKLMAILGSGFDRALIKTMGMACSDPLVSIRKAAISALSVAFRTFLDNSVAIEWLHSVPALISDNESSIQEECENLFVELVLERVSTVGSEINTGSVLPEGELGLLKEICNGEVAPWVKKICTNLGKKNRLKHKYATALQSIIRTSESLWLNQSMPIEKWTAPPGSWFLLSELSAYLAKAVEWEFLRHHWQLFDKHGVGGEIQSPLPQGCAHEEGGRLQSNSVAWAGDRVFLLQTISNVSIELPSEVGAELAHDLLRRIQNFNMHSTEVNAHVKAFRTLCKRKVPDPEAADALVKKCVHEIASKASNILGNYISKESETTRKGGFFTPPISGSKMGKRAITMSKSLSKVVTAVYTIGSLVIICPSADMRGIIDLLYTVITSGNSDPKVNKVSSSTISLKHTAPSLYIQAWLTLGKICLTDEKTAKKYIPLFVQELEKSDCAALRNNLVVVMADFCIRHTSLVDSYIPRITKCLRDPCELVRRQTFILLSRLLQRDYVKWRGVLFLRFLLSLVDESEKIKQLANFLFSNILKAKAPLLGYNSFVEAIFVLNDCRAHKGHAGGHGSRAESRLFSIRGNDETSRSRRMHIYVSLLKQMAPEHLLQTFVKLCTEILAAASDGMLNLDDITGQSVLQDAFQIIACKEIRIPSNRGLSSDAGDIDEEGADNGGAAAKGRAITQALKKGLIQSTIPIFIELKRLLESKNSPLIGSLMECLRIILKDYRNEIEDILVADKQLQKELIYDMQKYEKAKTKSTAAETVATHQRTVSFHSPGISKIASVRQAHNKSIGRLQGDVRLASAMGDVAAEAVARSVLKDMNKGRQTPPLSALSVPKLKTCEGGQTSRSGVPLNVLESVRRRQNFDFVEEN